MSSTPTIELTPPMTPQEWDLGRHVLREYGQSLGVDLSFQGFDDEIRALDAAFTGEGEAFLLAWVEGEVAACGALRSLPDVDEPNACEMKRLYVRPPFRRFGLGRLMARALMDRAVAAGYRAMYLDTLSDMAAARELYASLGFEPVEPYYYNPLPGAHHFRADLGAAAGRY